MRVLGIETSCDETAVAVVEAPAGDAPLGGLLSRLLRGLLGMLLLLLLSSVLLLLSGVLALLLLVGRLLLSSSFAGGA